LLGAFAAPFINDRQAHVDAVGLGLGITEHDDPRAAEEIRQLWQIYQTTHRGKAW
jgi:hypothetical protein